MQEFDPSTTANDGAAALLLVSALIVNIESRGGDVLRPVQETIVEMFSRPLDGERKLALRAALNVLGGIREGLVRHSINGDDSPGSRP